MSALSLRFASSNSFQLSWIRKSSIAQVAIGFALVMALSACGKIGDKHKETNSSKSDAPTVADGLELNREPVIPPGTQLPDFTVLVDKAAPAVVNISITQKVTTHRMSDDEEPPFGDFSVALGLHPTTYRAEKKAPVTVKSNPLDQVLL